MRLIRFLKRLKGISRIHRYAPLWVRIKWAWLQSKNGKADYDKIQKINIKELADEIFNKKDL